MKHMAIYIHLTKLRAGLFVKHRYSYIKFYSASSNGSIISSERVVSKEDNVGRYLDFGNIFLEK